MIDEKIKIIDFQLDARGPMEDEFYSLDPFLVKNVRRGNTILQVQEDGKDSKYLMARKGLPKFFDMRVEYIDAVTRKDMTQLSVEERNHKIFQLAGALKGILQGHQVEIIKTVKANGENAQVSWNPDIDAWIICSKNVGIVVRKREDINLYPPDKCSFAMEIAQSWYTYLTELSENGKHPERIEALKKDIANITLVGEYIGNPTH